MIKCDRPHIGIGVIIINTDGKILLMKRKGSLGNNTWGFPGGKLEKFEEIKDCAIRETKEEVGLDIINLTIDRFTNDMFIDEDTHYVTIFVKCNAKSYDAKILEPEKCTDIGWFNWDDFPDNIFLPIINYKK